MENAKQLVGQKRLRIEPGTSPLTVLCAELLGNWWGQI